MRNLALILTLLACIGGLWFAVEFYMMEVRT